MKMRYRLYMVCSDGSENYIRIYYTYQQAKDRALSSLSSERSHLTDWVDYKIVGVNLHEEK